MDAAAAWRRCCSSQRSRSIFSYSALAADWRKSWYVALALGGCGAGTISKSVDVVEKLDMDVLACCVSPRLAGGWGAALRLLVMLLPLLPLLLAGDEGGVVGVESPGSSRGDSWGFLPRCIRSFLKSIVCVCVCVCVESWVWDCIYLSPTRSISEHSCSCSEDIFLSVSTPF